MSFQLLSSSHSPDSVHVTLPCPMGEHKPSDTHGLPCPSHNTACDKLCSRGPPRCDSAQGCSLLPPGPALFRRPGTPGPPGTQAAPLVLPPRSCSRPALHTHSPLDTPQAPAEGGAPSSARKLFLLCAGSNHITHESLFSAGMCFPLSISSPLATMETTCHCPEVEFSHSQNSRG